MPDPDPWSQTHRCATCRYWGQRRPHWNTVIHRTCASPYLLYGPQLRQARAQPAAAVAELQEGWGLLTGPAWGCVHWAGTADVIEPNHLTEKDEDDGNAPPAA